jgi:presenilin-like A22 family membrane protease
MKKNDWILIIATALYSYLFYREAAGINFFIFSIGLIALLLARGQELRHKKKWLIVAAGTCISGAAVAIYGNWLSLWANVISLMLLSGMSVSTRSSVIMTLFHSAYSAGGAIVFMVLDAIERKPASQSSQRKT